MKKLWILLGLVALITGPVAAGVVYEIEVTDHEQSPPKTHDIEMVVEGKRIKVGIVPKGEGKPGDVIFRGDRREMVVVDHENGSYHVVDEATMKKIAGQVSGAMSHVEDALTNVPEDKRAMIEQMMKQKMKQKMPSGARVPQRRSESELRKTGETGTKNGFPSCVKYEVYRNGHKFRELCVTDWDNVEGGSEVVGAFEDMADFFREMLDSIPDFGHGGAGGVGSDPVFEHMKELGGFPVVTKEFGDDGSLEGETTLRSAKRQTIDPDAFEPPSSYKREEILPGR